VMPHERPAFPERLGHALALIPAATPTILVTTRPVDWETFGRAAAQRETPIDGRTILEIEVHEDVFSRFYEDASPAVV